MRFYIKILILLGKPPKKRKKNSQQLWTVGGGRVSKFWCVNLKKVLFLELIFQKNMLNLIHIVPFVCLHKIQSLNSFKIPDAGFHLYILPFKIMWETGVLVPFGMARGGYWAPFTKLAFLGPIFAFIRIQPRRISDLIENLNSSATNFWPNWEFENSTMQNISTAISNFGPERWKLFIICLFRAWL